MKTRLTKILCLMVLVAGAHAVAIVRGGECDCWNEDSERQVTPISPREAAVRTARDVNSSLARERVVTRDAEGKVIRDESGEFALGIQEGFQRIRPDELQAILEVIEAEVPDDVFSRLDGRRRREIIGAIEKWVRGFPTSVPGEHHSPEDAATKLVGLRLQLKGLVKLPVFEFVDADRIHTQLTALVDAWADQLVTVSLEAHPHLRRIPVARGLVRELIWTMLCPSVCDTSSPIFKSPLTTDAFDQARSQIAPLVREQYRVPQHLLSPREDEQLAGLKPTEIESFLSERFRSERLARSLVASIGAGVLSHISQPFVKAAHARGVFDSLQTVADREQVQNYTDQMKLVVERERRRQAEFQQRQRDRFLEQAQRDAKEVNEVNTVLPEPMPDRLFE